MKPHWLSIQNKADHEEILIQGPIGSSWWDDTGTSEKEFCDALKSIPEGRKITIGINSEGGSIKDGLGIYNAIKRRSADITTRVDGYAVSVASIVALAGSRVVSPKSSIWMIHEPWSMTVGNADDHRKAAESLEKHAETLVSIYEDETGHSREEVREAMKSETWFRGDEAVEWGLADEVSDQNAALNSIDFTKFRNTPNSLLHGLVAGHGAITGSATENTTKAETMDKPNTTAAAESTTPPAAIQPTPAPTIDVSAIISELQGIRAALPQPAPAIPAGAQPVRVGGSAENIGDADDRLIVMPKGSARMTYLANAWGDIRKARVRKNPVNVNTVAADLTTDMLSQAVVTNIQNRLAPIAALFLEVSQDPIKPKATVQVANVTTGPTGQKNPTDWESGDTIVDHIAVTVDEYSTSFHVTNDELQHGLRMAMLSNLASSKFADLIFDVMAALLTTAYTNTVVSSSAAAFGANERALLWSSAKNFTLRNLVVDGSYWARMLPATTENFSINQGSPAYGFDGMWYANRWSAAASGVQGFVCSPEAMVCVAGLPIEPPGANVQFSSLTTTLIEKLGFSVQTAAWSKPGTRVQWQAFDMMFGAQRGDVTALTLLTT